MILENVVSTCLGRDIGTWKVSSRRIIKHIRSRSYTLITPRVDLEEFVRITPGEFSVIPEEAYITPKLAKLLRRKTAASSTGASRYGWYLHQLIKLSALEKTSESGLSLIWDADTAPLKDLSFERDGKILFYKSNEYHHPYFLAIHNLLALNKINKFSFVAQCIPYRGSWARSFFDTIEARGQKDWNEYILDCIDFEETSGFSEYETLGTFAANYYPNEIMTLDNRWCREGNGLIGSANNLSLFEGILKKRYDFIAFESWDKAYSRHLANSSRLHFKKLLNMRRIP